MIRAIINHSDDRKTVLLGITAYNIEQLKSNRPLRIYGNDIGIKHDIFIIYGENEMHVIKILQPYINGETKFEGSIKDCASKNNN